MLVYPNINKIVADLKPHLLQYNSMGYDCWSGCVNTLALPESHAKSTTESLNHFPNHSKKPVRSWPRAVRGAGRPSAQLRLGPRGPLDAAHRSALRASGIAKEGEYARELTNFYEHPCNSKVCKGWCCHPEIICSEPFPIKFSVVSSRAMFWYQQSLGSSSPLCWRTPSSHLKKEYTSTPDPQQAFPPGTDLVSREVHAQLVLTMYLFGHHCCFSSSHTFLVCLSTVGLYCWHHRLWWKMIQGSLGNLLYKIDGLIRNTITKPITIT